MNETLATEAYKILLLAYKPGIDVKTFRQNAMAAAREQKETNPVAVSLIRELPHISNAELTNVMEKTARLYERMIGLIKLLDTVEGDDDGTNDGD